MKTLASTSSEHQKRRIINELKEFTKENHDDMRVFPSQEKYVKLKFRLLCFINNYINKATING